MGLNTEELGKKAEDGFITLRNLVRKFNVQLLLLGTTDAIRSSKSSRKDGINGYNNLTSTNLGQQFQCLLVVTEKLLISCCPFYEMNMKIDKVVLCAVEGYSRSQQRLPHHLQQISPVEEVFVHCPCRLHHLTRLGCDCQPMSRPCDPRIRSAFAWRSKFQMESQLSLVAKRYPGIAVFLPSSPARQALPSSCNPESGKRSQNCNDINF